MTDDSSRVEVRALAAKLGARVRQAVLTIEPEGTLQLDGTDAASFERALEAGLAERDELGAFALTPLGRNVRAVLADEA